jgi:hypothetical protein
MDYLFIITPLETEYAIANRPKIINQILTAEV